MNSNEIIDNFPAEMDKSNSEAAIEEALFHLANEVGTAEISISNAINDLPRRFPGPNVGLEAFKTLVPDLWNAYNNLPIVEFTDRLNNAIKFCELLKDSYPLDLNVPPPSPSPSRPHPRDLKKT